MNPKKALQPHEIRVIKIDRKAILELIWEILSEISYEKFRLPHSPSYRKKLCINRFFDEAQGEIILLAHSRAYSIDTEAAIAYIRNLPWEPIDSLLLAPDGNAYYHSIYGASFVPGHTTSTGTLLDHLGLRVRPLRRHEIRVIRLSQQAVHELLWEHFMKTGDEVMDIPEVEIDDYDKLGTIYRMSIQGALEALTLYVMNVKEATEDVLDKNQEYCDQNIPFTTDSYFRNPANGRAYVSVILPKP